jgi:hypothetical protein
MDLPPAEALSEARRLIRTLDSAPNPQQQAQSAMATLMRCSSWPPASQRKILDLAAWLATRPAPKTLKARCQALLKGLG